MYFDFAIQCPKTTSVAFMNHPNIHSGGFIHWYRINLFNQP